jgi:hypothetical protein
MRSRVWQHPFNDPGIPCDHGPSLARSDHSGHSGTLSVRTIPYQFPQKKNCEEKGDRISCVRYRDGILQAGFEIPSFCGTF